jgi:hypothetical protein
LFSGSIADNITSFREVDPQKVIDAARQAGLHEMILRLPHGYGTMLGMMAVITSARSQPGVARIVRSAARSTARKRPGSVSTLSTKLDGPQASVDNSIQINIDVEVSVPIYAGGGVLASYELEGKPPGNPDRTAPPVQRLLVGGSKLWAY